MGVIYEPKGAAAEYAKLACNAFTTCLHKCRYCYCPLMLHKKPEAFHCAGPPKKDFLKRLAKDCERLKGDPREVLFSFVGDCCQDRQAVGLTGQALLILGKAGMKATILTKGGMRAEPLFPLLREYGFSFGTSLVWNKNKECALWEPGAATLNDRLEAISLAYFGGIKTWASVEPVIDPNHALSVIHDLRGYVDHFKVGKIEHDAKLEAAVDWAKFYIDVTDLLDSLGADYYIKESLRKYAPQQEGK